MRFNASVSEFINARLPLFANIGPELEYATASWDQSLDNRYDNVHPDFRSGTMHF